MIEFGEANGGVIHHGRDEIAALGNLAKVFFLPVHVGERVPSSGRRVGGDGENLSGRESNFEFFEEQEEVFVSGGHGLDVDLNSGEAGMVFQKGEGGVDEVLPPTQRLGRALVLEDPTNPGDDFEVCEVVEKKFGLLLIDHRNGAVGTAGAKVWEEVTHSLLLH